MCPHISPENGNLRPRLLPAAAAVAGRWRRAPLVRPRRPPPLRPLLPPHRPGLHPPSLPLLLLPPPRRRPVREAGDGACGMGRGRVDPDAPSGGGGGGDSGGGGGGVGGEGDGVGDGRAGEGRRVEAESIRQSGRSGTAVWCRQQTSRGRGTCSAGAVGQRRRPRATQAQQVEGRHGQSRAHTEQAQQAKGRRRATGRLTMYDAVEFELHVQEPYFTQLRAGAKKVEGRLAAGNYIRITQGSLLLFNKCLLLNVEAVRQYSSFSEMLQTEMISNVLPGISSIEEGVKVYRKFYTEEKENSNGVLAISISKPPSQPYITMIELLAGLGYDGLARLLGMTKTAGTVPNGLPPRSVLISSCMKLHQPTE